jgi:hypothetical protein
MQGWWVRKMTTGKGRKLERRRVRDERATCRTQAELSERRRRRQMALSRILSMR